MTYTTVLCIITILSSIFAWNNRDFYATTIMNPYLVDTKKQYYRFLTSGFIHANWMHLAFNMFSFYFFGNFLEMYYEALGYKGGYYFVFLYVVGIIVSDIPTFLKQKHNPGYNSLGASGGVASVIFSYIMVAPLNDILIYFIRVPAFIFGGIYLIYSYYMARSSKDGINHEAHFWGAVFGIIFTIISFPGIVPEFFRQLSEWKLPFL